MNTSPVQIETVPRPASEAARRRLRQTVFWWLIAAAVPTLLAWWLALDWAAKAVLRLLVPA